MPSDERRRSQGEVPRRTGRFRFWSVLGVSARRRAANPHSSTESYFGRNGQNARLAALSSWRASKNSGPGGMVIGPLFTGLFWREDARSGEPQDRSRGFSPRSASKSRSQIQRVRRPLEAQTR